MKTCQVCQFLIANGYKPCTTPGPAGHFVSAKHNHSVTNIHDLPLDVFCEVIFSYLTDVDILNFGKTGNRKFLMIAEDYLKCKHNLIIPLHDLNLILII